MKVALDTNILAYAAGVDDAERQAVAQGLIGRIDVTRIVLPQQVAGEFYNVLIRKGRHSRETATAVVGGWLDLFGARPSSPAAFAQAMILATEHAFQIWDALIVCTAAEAGCDLLLSEDMHEGFRHRGLTIANPFAAEPHPRLQALLDALPEDPR